MFTRPLHTSAPLSRESAALISAFGRLGPSARPGSETVQRLMDVALSRAQREAASATSRAAATAAGSIGSPETAGKTPAGVEAAGVAGLLAAAGSSLGFQPSVQWCEEARPLLAPVMARITDPVARRRLMAALDGGA